MPTMPLASSVSAVAIVNAKRNAVVMAEIKLRQIAMQMLLGAMLVGAAHAALEHAEIAFDRVGGDDGGFDNRLAVGALSPVTSFQ